MKTKLLLIGAMFIFGLSACSPYIDPRHNYPPHYRTYQDKTHGGIDDGHGGQNLYY